MAIPPAGPRQPLSSWRQRWWAILRKLSLIDNEATLERGLLTSLTAVQRPTTVAFVNAHAMNCIVGDQGFSQSLLQADYLLRDGSGMKKLLDWAGLKAGLNLNGTDLIPRLIQRYDGRRIALLGTIEPYLSAAAEHVRRELASGAQVLLANGFETLQHYEQLVATQRPELIVLGMGMPKQEAVAQRLRETLQHPCVIVCGGAIIDFMGGKVHRAPAWMRAIGIEWLYRLALEPVRLFRRYVIGNPLFLIRALRVTRAAR